MLNQFNSLKPALHESPKTLELGLGTINGRFQTSLGCQLTEKSSVHYSYSSINTNQSYNFLVISGNSSIKSSVHSISYASVFSVKEAKNAFEWQVGLGKSTYSYTERLTSLLGISPDDPIGVVSEKVNYQHVEFTGSALWHTYKKRRDVYIGLRTNHNFYADLAIDLIFDETHYKSSGYKLPTIGPVLGINWQKGIVRLGCQAGLQFGESLLVQVDDSYEFHGELIPRYNHVYYSSSQAYAALHLGFLLNSKSAK